MSILSLEYLLFAAGTFALYHLFPLKRRWLALLAASAAFDLLAGWQGAAYLLSAAARTYGSALWLHVLQETGKTRRMKLLLAGTLLLTLGGMVFFKYAGGRLFQGLLAPLGLSWFTFQSAGYVVDVYRGKVKPERNFGKYLLFVSFFPQLTQGPISTWAQLAPQLEQGHRLEPSQSVSGVLLMCWGLFKKLVIADRLAAVTAYVTVEASVPGWTLLLGAATYMVRLYADFSGGMDVIRGTALLMGIDMAENFRRPFFAVSVADYWRRWHITLGAWFRSYLLYPLTTSRAGVALGRAGVRLLGKRVGRRLPAALATLVVFLLIGLWHGASWNAVLYGQYFGVLMGAATLLEPTLRGLKKRLHIREGARLWKGLCIARTLLLVLTAQFFAFTADAAQAFALIGRVFTGWTCAGVAQTLLSVMPALEWGIALAAGGVLFAVDAAMERGVRLRQRLAEGPLALRWAVLLALILVTVVLGCYGDDVNAAAFLYTLL